MEFKITINGKKFKAVLSDSDAVRQLAAQCPLEETFQKSGEHEFFCRLGRGINVCGMDGTSDIHRNGIYYFADWKALSFVYKDMERKNIKKIKISIEILYIKYGIIII